MSIELIIAILLILMVFVFALVCVTLVNDNRELKNELEKAQDLYLREVGRNIDRLKEDIFGEDIEMLKNTGHDK